MEVKVITEKEEFKKLRHPWTIIANKMKDATPFQTWEMNYYWMDAHPEGELFLIVALEVKEIFGVAPLVIKDSVIQFIGDVHFDYGQFVCSERKGEITELFFKTIRQTAEKRELKIHLTNIPVQSDAFAFCREEKTRLKHSVWREQVDTANIKLEEYDGFDGYLRAISTSLRRKAIKPCLKETLNYEIEPFTEELWADIENIYLRRQEDRVGVSTLSWAKEVIRNLSEEGILKISTIHYNNSRVAYLIFYEYKNNDYVWLTAFMQTGKLQLGHYVRYCLIKRAFELGIKKIDMMRGAYGYKKQWDCNVSVNYELVSFTNGWDKTVYSAWKQIRPEIKEIVYGNDKVYRRYKEKWSKRL